MVDRATTLAQAEKSDLEFELSLLTRRSAHVSESATTTEANLLAVAAEKDAVQATVAGLPPGAVRERYERRLRRLTEREAQLTDRRTDFDGVVQVDNEFDRRRIGAALDEVTAYLAELALHRATLPA